MKKHLRLILLVTGVILALGIAVVHAQTTGGTSTALRAASLWDSTGYDLTWWTVDGGGGTVSGGGYLLAGTAGQPDAGASLTGGGYNLTGGFWVGGGGGSTPDHTIYLPVVSKQH